MSLLALIGLLSVFACGHGQHEQIFTSSIPRDYYQRRDLSDCSERFHHRKYFNPQCLIFGGEQANVTDFPHMAVLGWPVVRSSSSNDTSEPQQILWQCGGSLITERFVLTAAHCAADGNNVPPRFVRLGDVNLASTEDDEYAQQFEIRQIVRHPEHRFSRKYYDLALVELSGAVRLTVGVCPACLWTKHTLPAAVFQTAGFGATGFGRDPIPNLLKTNLRSMETGACAKLFKNTRGLAEGIASDQLCAFELQADTCQGDSGGPLQVSLRSFRSTHPVVVALTSFGQGCGIGSTGVYQRVASHIAWIESVVNDTMDPVRCAERYEQYRRWSVLVPECTLQSAYINRVRLVWPTGVKGPPMPCSGTFIDYNTVVTSARCVRDVDGVQPTEIELLQHESKARAKIVEIQVHPEFDGETLRNDLALLRLDQYLLSRDNVAPSCIPVPRPAEICSEQQTHDPMACWQLFTLTTKEALSNSICRPQSIEQSKVKLVWSQGANDGRPGCVGMLIKTNTVITSIRCMNRHGSSEPPAEIELASGRRVRIVKILRHPGFRESASRGNDTALLLLPEDGLTAEERYLVPSCIQEASRANTNHVSVYGKYQMSAPTGSVNLRVRQMCNETMKESFTDRLGGSLANDPRYTCWDTEQKVIPGAVPLEPGAGLMDETHQFIDGVVAFDNSFGSVDPVISTNLSAYADWITRFVLYRPPKLELVYRTDGEDEFETGSKCTLRNGTAGSCMPDYACGREILAHSSNGDVTICGFEGSISYVCCPAGHQDIPLLNEIEIPDFDPFPPLPYENLESYPSRVIARPLARA